MTTPAACPASPEAPRSKRLLGFYIGPGVVILLFVAGYFAWTPLRVSYWERELRGFLESAPEDQGYGVICRKNRPAELAMGTGKTVALGKLLDIGRPSATALRRVLRSLSPSRRATLLDILGVMDADWLPPVIVDFVGDKDSEASIGNQGRASSPLGVPPKGLTPHLLKRYHLSQ